MRVFEKLPCLLVPKNSISDDVLLSEAGGAEEEKCVDFPRLPEEQEVWLSNMRLLVLGMMDWLLVAYNAEEDEYVDNVDAEAVGVDDFFGGDWWNNLVT